MKDERAFLQKFAKILNAEEAFEQIEKQDQRERRLLELMWAVSDTGVFIDAPAARSFCPAIPSAILTVTEAAL
jgi:hypothetical protein